jgi:hypothetical protein
VREPLLYWYEILSDVPVHKAWLGSLVKRAGGLRREPRSSVLLCQEWSVRHRQARSCPAPQRRTKPREPPEIPELLSTWHSAPYPPRMLREHRRFTKHCSCPGFLLCLSRIPLQLELSRRCLYGRQSRRSTSGDLVQLGFRGIPSGIQYQYHLLVGEHALGGRQSEIDSASSENDANECPLRESN